MRTQIPLIASLLLGFGVSAMAQAADQPISPAKYDDASSVVPTQGQPYGGQQLGEHESPTPSVSTVQQVPIIG